MHIKDKLAALRRRLAFKLAVLLRRWAFKLDNKRTEPSYGDGFYLPSGSPLGLSYYQIRRLEMAYRVSPNEEMNYRKYKYERSSHTDALNRMHEDYQKHIANEIADRLWEDGVIEYDERRDLGTQELTIIGCLYVGINKEKENSNPNKNSELC